ncbi:hypothetical protein ACHAW6_012078 [Cyclotella cf. meneghiniana]
MYSRHWERYVWPLGVDLLLVKTPLELKVFGWVEYRACQKLKAIGDLRLMAVYILWQVGEYTIKGLCNHTKQTQ